MNLYFLQADKPLTKSYTKRGGELIKTPYPMTWEFTSHEEQCNDLPTMLRLMTKHAALGHCLLKGQLAKPLVQESRAGSTNTNDSTEWLCLDLDGLPENLEVQNANGQTSSVPLTLDLFLSEMGLGDISYIVQWSASYGISDNKIRAHVIMLVDKGYAAPLIKQWLIQKNHEVPLLRGAMELTKTGNTIRWPLDISACQNDKLIYIAPPVLKGIKDPMGKTPRIQLVKRKYDILALSSGINTTEKNKQLTHARINELRDAAGLVKRKFNYKVVGGTEVMLKPDESVITEMKTERGYVYFNLNGGDSWAYYHPENRPDYIYNFKGEPTYLTKELLPDYWGELTKATTKANSSGIIYLAFCDRKTGTYWRGTYDSTADNLDIYQAKNETQLRDFCKQHGVPLGDFIPEWDLVFDPHDNVRVDVSNRTVNRFKPSNYMKAVAKRVQKCPSTIFKVMHHALGSDVDITEHFVNWIAYVLQYRDRTKTAWVMHGTQGCLAAETQIEFKRGKRNAGRPLSIKEAYEKWTGVFKSGRGIGKGWDMNLTTFAKSVRDSMTVGYHEVFKIVESGEKQLYRLTTSAGRSIRVTELHPFMRPDGSFTPLNELKPGDEIVAEGVPINAQRRGGRNKKRVTVYSIPFHPFAWKHTINGKNYKRSHRARLVVEAAMNHLSLHQFISILRTDETKALSLRYLREDEIVHHVDENPSNDALTNLEVVDKANHDAHHAKEVGMGFLSTKTVKVKSIKKDKIEMTYDMVMKAPYHNYIANGIAVSNTGKGILTNNVLRPIFGAHATTRRMEELSEKYNGYIADNLLVFVDEVQIRALENERGVVAKMKNFITEEIVPIRLMHANPFDVRNYTNWIFMSNMSDPVVIPKNDRRHNVGKYQPNKLEITDQEIAQIDKELQQFHDYLMSYAVDVDMARTVIQSEDRDNMITLSESSVDTIASALLDGTFEYFLNMLPTGNNHERNALLANKVEAYRDTLKALMLRTKPDGSCNIARDELHSIFDYLTDNTPKSPNKFTSLLKHHRIHITKVWVNSKAVQGLQVGWTDAKEFAKYTTEHFAPPKAVKAKAK